MTEHTYRSPISDNAVERITDTWQSGGKQRAFYLIDGEEIGFRFWTASGVLTMEVGLQDGVKHGPYRTWHDNGQVEEESTYIVGKEHGITRQYDENGVQIGSYVMEHGTGLDLWYRAPEVLSESREYVDGDIHGYERWWHGGNQMVWQEGHFSKGIEHGIFRRWNQHGRLRRGNPQYYIKGKRVNKRQYERACKSDPTLPPFVPDDNLAYRKLPNGVLPSRQAK